MRIPVFTQAMLSHCLKQNRVPVPEVPADHDGRYLDLPDIEDRLAYAVILEADQKVLDLSGSGFAVFSSDAGRASAMKSVYLAGLQNATLFIGELVRNESPGLAVAEDSAVPVRLSRRKSFMTPTPLHIPTSRVSPIPGYTHESLFFKIEKPDSNNFTEVVPSKTIQWLHPLIHLVPKENRGESAAG